MTGFIQSIITVVLFLAILGILVLIHEVGHFIVARLARVRVHEFAIGFPPRARILRSDGETLYTLNWLPIGGYVKLEGEDGDSGDDPRSFSAQRLPVKLTILVAGVAMNVLLAFAIFTAIAWLATPLVGIKFYVVQPNSPAANAGLVSGDAIIAVDGQRYEFFGRQSILDGVRAKAGETAVLTIVHPDGSRSDVPVALRPPAQIDQQQGALGISGPKEHPFEAYFFGEYTGRDLPSAVAIGTNETGRAFGLILDGLGSLVSSVATNPGAPPPVQGPVGIATQIGLIFWTAGPILTLYTAGILSANLALVNVLPLPPLDGGRMLIITLKSLAGIGGRVARRFGIQVDGSSAALLRAERLTYVIGFFFLMGFLVWITYFDLLGGRSR